MAEEKKTNSMPHNLVLEDRRLLTLSGVSDVDSFDEETVDSATENREYVSINITEDAPVADVEEEFHVSDTNMEFNMGSADSEKLIPASVANNFIRALQAVDNGIYSMCQDEALAYMVETSSNIASIITTEDKITVVASQRSNVMSNLENMCNTIRACFELAGAEVKHSDGYPAWKMRADSQFTKLVTDTYVSLFGKQPIVKGIHAGLECGLFSERYPNLDMVSFGPTLRFVHTPEERLLIPTVQMVWVHLKEILKNIPCK